MSKILGEQDGLNEITKYLSKILGRQDGITIIEVPDEETIILSLDSDSFETEIKLTVEEL